MNPAKLELFSRGLKKAVVLVKSHWDLQNEEREDKFEEHFQFFLSLTDQCGLLGTALLSQTK